MFLKNKKRLSGVLLALSYILSSLAFSNLLTKSLHNTAETKTSLENGIQGVPFCVHLSQCMHLVGIFRRKTSAAEVPSHKMSVSVLSVCKL